MNDHMIEVSYPSEVQTIHFSDELDLHQLCNLLKNTGYLRIEGEYRVGVNTQRGPIVFLAQHIISIS